MIRNVHKSIITSIIGVLFMLSAIAYPFIVEKVLEEIIITLIITGIVLLFASDAHIKRLIDRIVK